MGFKRQLNLSAKALLIPNSASKRFFKKKKTRKKMKLPTPEIKIFLPIIFHKPTSIMLGALS
ncbi:hypothetical protein [Chryseobacterium sp. SC28]|uniref:hypothetical protein n=1 Tax=Chryseobacterium sp. SC28 TaxID=2268028 RepID=UPI000F6475D3|nr:hypothetical protein [Chryseobacterium sp. SC28]